MLRVDVMLCPGGAEELARKIDVLYIWNVSNLAPLSDYEVLGYNGLVSVKGHKREDGALALVRKAIQALEGAAPDG